MREYDSKTGHYVDKITGKHYSSQYSTTPIDNTGNVTMGINGDLNVGIGGGMTMDLTNGHLGYSVGGVTFDF